MDDEDELDGPERRVLEATRDLGYSDDDEVDQVDEVDLGDVSAAVGITGASVETARGVALAPPKADVSGEQRVVGEPLLQRGYDNDDGSDEGVDEEAAAPPSRSGRFALRANA